MLRRTKIFIRLSLSLLTTVGSCRGIVKHWLPDTEWQTGSNWIDNALPDAHSCVVFPEQTRHVVGLANSGNVEVAKMYLPIEGTLAFGRNAIFTLTESKKPEKYSTWAKKGPFLWIDPDNWNGYNPATPHADRIPCSNDIVVLPDKNRSFSVSLPVSVVQVAEVRIAGDDEPLAEWQWRDLVEEERAFTASRFTVVYADEDPLDRCSNCACHRDDAVVEEVCSFMRRGDKCGPLVCEYPLKVDGHCCAFCGGRLELSNGASAVQAELAVQEALKTFREVITWHFRNTRDGNVEILIAENGEYSGINSEEAIDVLAKAFTDHGFDVSAIQASGSALDVSSMTTIIGPLLVIPVILVLLLLALFPYYGYSYSQVYTAWLEALPQNGDGSSTERKPKSGGTFAFARFKNVPEGDVDLTENIVDAETEHVEVDSEAHGSSSSSKRFENPLYRSTRDVDKSKTIAETQMIDVDVSLSLSALDGKSSNDRIEELTLE